MALEGTTVDPLTLGGTPCSSVTLLWSGRGRRAWLPSASLAWALITWAWALCPPGLWDLPSVPLPCLIWVPVEMSVDFSTDPAVMIIHELITFYIQWNRKPFINMIFYWFREPLILATFWHFGKTKQQSCIIWSFKNKFKTHLMDRFML